MMIKIKLFSIIITFVLCFPLHFVFDFFPIKIVTPFVPVNESIWEHMKLIFTSFVISNFIEDYLLRNKNIYINNKYLQMFISPIIGIIIYLIIFIPLYNNFGENLFISLFLLFIVIIIEHIISYYIYNFKDIKYEKLIGIIGLIIVYIIFYILTYYPIKTPLFFDELNQNYGINKE